MTIKKMGYVFYNGVNYIMMMSFELCIVESLLEVHAFIEYSNHEDGKITKME